MNLYIQHKVGPRSVSIMEASLEQLGLPYRMLGSGLVEVRVQLQPEQFDQLKAMLQQMGLELVDVVSFADFNYGLRK